MRLHDVSREVGKLIREVARIVGDRYPSWLAGKSIHDILHQSARGDRDGQEVHGVRPYRGVLWNLSRAAPDLGLGQASSDGAAAQASRPKFKCAVKPIVQFVPLLAFHQLVYAKPLPTFAIWSVQESKNIRVGGTHQRTAAQGGTRRTGDSIHRFHSILNVERPARILAEHHLRAR